VHPSAAPFLCGALETDSYSPRIRSEVLTPADPSLHVDKHAFDVPFVCGCKDLGEALRRISEGAAMIRTKGELDLPCVSLTLHGHESQCSALTHALTRQVRPARAT